MAFASKNNIFSILNNSNAGDKIRVMGWVRTKREIKNVQFIALNDGSTLKNLQIVVDPQEIEENILKKVNTGAGIEVEGILEDSQGQGQSLDLKAKMIRVLGEADPEEYPIQPKKHSMEFLREVGHLRPRTNTFSAIFRLRHQLAMGIHRFFDEEGFYYLHSPIITGSDAEGAGEMFRVSTLDARFAPLKNEYLDSLAEKYYQEIKELCIEHDIKIGEIDKALSHEFDNLSFKELVTASKPQLEKFLRKINKGSEATKLVKKTYFKIRLGLFKFLEDNKATFLPDWLFQGLNLQKNVLRIGASKTRFRLRFKHTIKDAGFLLTLSFFNLDWVDRFNFISDSSIVDWSEDFFGKETNLTVSGQLEAEIGALALSRVYTFGPTFRAENSNTTRHLAEFWMIEPEMAFFDLEDNIDLAEKMLKSILQYVLKNSKEDLEFLAKRFDDEQKQKPQNERSPWSLLERIEFVINNDFVRVSYDDAFEILRNSKPNKKKKFEFPVNEWGMDFQSEHEKFLVEKHFGSPVVIYNYPSKIKAFYMRENEDKRTVGAMDILFPAIGEIVGGSQREERYDVLLEKIRANNIPEKDVWWYLETRKFGSVPHSGFGLGFERLMVFLTGMGNIRDVIPFPRAPKLAEY